MMSRIGQVARKMKLLLGYFTGCLNTTNRAVKHLAIITKNDEYGTPLFLFQEACQKFKCSPVIDYFASHTNHTLKKYYTKNEDAFLQEWTDPGFINPPYSMVAKVIKKAWEEHQKHNIELLLLTYSKSDTRWWHEFVEEKAEVHFVKGRIKFLDSKGKQTKLSAPYPSCWIIYRPKEDIKVRVQSMFPNRQKYGKLR